MRQEKKIRTRELVLGAVFCAIIVVLAFTPLGYIRFNPVLAITLIGIPVIVGAVALGPAWGAFLGFVFGVTSFVQCFGMDAFGTALFQISPVYTVITCIGARTLMGWLTALLYRGLTRKAYGNRLFSLVASSVCGSLFNTVFFLGALGLLFGRTEYIVSMRAGASIIAFLIAAAGINAILEAVAAGVIVPAIYYAILPRECALGIDIGASTTKLAVVKGSKCLRSTRKRADESLEQAVERLGLSGVRRIAVTGVGASYIEGSIASLPTKRVDEFASLYHGATQCAKNHNCVVVSLGTGTSFVRVSPFGARHLGGTGVGGGMLLGLSERLLGITDVDELTALAENGDLSGVNLELRDVCRGTISNLVEHTTVANLAKLGKANEADTARGLFSLVFETIGVMAAFAVKKHWTRTAVVVGTVTEMPMAKKTFHAVAELHHLKFVVPENAGYATAIGAAQL